MRANWMVQLIILGITILVFRFALERTGPAVAIAAGVVTFLAPTIIWLRLKGKDAE